MAEKEITNAVSVKNIIVTPRQLPNDGSGEAEVRCSVFTPNEFAKIESVKLFFAPGVRSPKGVHLKPDYANIVASTGEGEYVGKLPIPWLMDSGLQSFRIVATDSQGLRGQNTGEIKIIYRKKDTLPAVGTAEFKEILEATGKQPFRSHNRVEVLDTGKKAFSKRLALIEEAAQQINLQSYTFDAGGLCKQILDALLNKARQGVDVNVILNTDSQIPTSPIDTLRLKLQGILLNRHSKGEGYFFEEPTSGPSILKNLIDRNAPSGLNLLLFSADNVRRTTPQGSDKVKAISHWLKRMRRERLPTHQPEPKEKPEWLSQFKGPGGLPALPLLDYGSHEKLLVVDGKKAILGGRNLEDEYFTHWIDLDLYLEGPVINQIQKGYLRSYQDFSTPTEKTSLPRKLYNGNPQQEGIEVQFVQSFPWKKEYCTLLSLVAAIQAANDHFYASSQYLVLPSSLLLDAILEAARRGVDIRILTNSFQTSREATFSSSYFASVNYIEPLLENGIRIFEIKGTMENDAPQPYYHIKEFLFDGSLAVVGSFNLSLRSCYVESENLVFIQDKPFCLEREKAFLNRIETQASELTISQIAEIRAQHNRKIELSQYIDLLF